MPRSAPSRLVCVAVTWICTASLPVPMQASDPRPNVVLIMTDDQGLGDLGFSGNPIVRTPRLDGLARESARLPYFYVSPVCAPTRASLLTGRYNYRTRAIDTYRGRALMDPGEVTLASRLRAAGYATGIFGKWHLGDTWPLRPHDRGFDMSLVHRGGGIGQPSDPPGGEGKYTDPLLFRNGRPEPQHGYCTDVYFTAGLEWAGQVAARGEPFFLYLPTNAPHGPLDDVPRDKYEYYRQQKITTDQFPRNGGHPTPEGLNADELARVYSMIENVDDNVGRLLDWLQGKGLAEQTLVVFLTDNGRATAGYNAGLRGRKSDVYEGGIRSPFLARWPGRLVPGVASRRIAAHIDLTPTILEACGITPPAAVTGGELIPVDRMDGRSLWPLLTRQAGEWPDRTLVIQSHRGDVPAFEHHFAVRTDAWKLVRNSGFGREQAPAGAPLELFDMQNDPSETRDVSAEHPQVVQDLRRRYAEWFADVSATRPDNYAPVRLQVGSEHENPTVLTRQDWRGADWKPDDQGHWEVNLVQEGRYEVTLRFAPREEETVAAFSLNWELRREQRVPPKAREAVFADVSLPAGPGRLDALIRNGSMTSGVIFVELRRLNQKP